MFHLKIAQYLNENGAVVDEKEENGCTPLYMASQEGYLEIVKYLIKNKAQVNVKCTNYCTSLHIATCK